MLAFRDKYVAHLDLHAPFTQPVPSFDLAIRTAYAYQEWARDLIRPVWLNQPAYESVLVRQAGLLGLRRQDAEGLVDYLCRVGHRQDIHFLWRPTLTDPTDEFILELAMSAHCEAIVTHNVRDFSGTSGLTPRILLPSEFLALLEE